MSSDSNESEEDIRPNAQPGCHMVIVYVFLEIFFLSDVSVVGKEAELITGFTGFFNFVKNHIAILLCMKQEKNM